MKLKSYNTNVQFLLAIALSLIIPGLALAQQEIIPQQLVGPQSVQIQSQIDRTPTLQIEVQQPQIQAIQPQLETIQPNLQVIQPQLNTVQPNLEVIQPQLDTIQPNLQVIQPQLDTIQPNLQVIQPQLNTIQPNPTVIQPQLDTIQPQLEIAKPQFEIFQPQSEIFRPSIDINQSSLQYEPVPETNIRAIPADPMATLGSKTIDVAPGYMSGNSSSKGGIGTLELAPESTISNYSSAGKTEVFQATPNSRKSDPYQINERTIWDVAPKSTPSDPSTTVGKNVIGVAPDSGKLDSYRSGKTEDWNFAPQSQEFDSASTGTAKVKGGLKNSARSVPSQDGSQPLQKTDGSLEPGAKESHDKTTNPKKENVWEFASKRSKQELVQHSIETKNVIVNLTEQVSIETENLREVREDLKTIDSVLTPYRRQETLDIPENVRRESVTFLSSISKDKDPSYSLLMDVSKAIFSIYSEDKSVVTVPFPDGSEIQLEKLDGGDSNTGARVAWKSLKNGDSGVLSPVASGVLSPVAQVVILEDTCKKGKEKAGQYKQKVQKIQHRIKIERQKYQVLQTALWWKASKAAIGKFDVLDTDIPARH